ncbi:MAG: hypothetical protein HZB59_05890 [Ignavibacteriales bacterium]|nr:hypothetical protein [Ignavibacteriales bacterium]
MNSKNILAIAYKVLSLYCLFLSLNVVRIIVQVFSYSGNNNTEMPSFWLALIPYFLQLLFVIVLWFRAGKLNEDTEIVSFSGDFNFHQLYIVAFTILGAYLFVDALTSLVFQLINSWVMKDFNYDKKLSTAQMLSIVLPSIKLILSLFVIYRASDIVTIINKLRQKSKLSTE